MGRGRTGAARNNSGTIPSHSELPLRCFSTVSEVFTECLVSLASSTFLQGGGGWRKATLVATINNMSTKENDIWLETTKVQFEEAIAIKDWELAEYIIRDVNDSGFEESAGYLNEQLKEAKAGDLE